MEKKLPFDLEQLKKIVAEYPTPFHIYDEAMIRANVRALKAAFKWNKGYQEYYAVKACPNPRILSIIKEEGAGVDCASETELMLAEALGFDGRDIMFSSNVTPAREFRYARKLNAIINLDDFSHIDFLAENGGIPETICCRYNPGAAFKWGNAIMGNPADSKYGFTYDQLVEGFKKLIALGAKRFGIHAFLVSNTVEQAYYPELARLMFKTARDLHDATGAEFAFVNLSGGVGIPYKPEQNPVDIMKVGSDIEKVYGEIFGGTGMTPAVFTELGRFVTGPAGYLVTTALHEKNTYKDFIGVDACASNLMRPAMYGAYHHITVVGKEHAPADHVYDVTGSLCESNDKFAIDRQLPKIDRGDYVVIHDTGAHGFSMGYNYNGKLWSKELLLKPDGSAELIRRAETPKDYFATLDMYDLPLLKEDKHEVD